MDCFASLAMTVQNAPSRSRGAMRPSFANHSPQKEEGEGNAGCALHPRSRVQNCAKETHTSIQVSGGTSASPAQWLYGLCRALPGDEFVLSPSSADERSFRIRSGSKRPPPT